MTITTLKKSKLSVVYRLKYEQVIMGGLEVLIMGGLEVLTKIRQKETDSG